MRYILLPGLLLVIIVTASLLAQERREDGGVSGPPNRNPSSLTSKDVDTLMWPWVRAINRSGWVWTTESCQGHTGDSPRPFLLGVVTNTPGRFLQAFIAAQARVIGINATELQEPKGLHMQVNLWTQPKVKLGRYQIQIVATDIVTARAVMANLVEQEFSKQESK